jgi:hypothetical protein
VLQVTDAACCLAHAQHQRSVLWWRAKTRRLDLLEERPLLPWTGARLSPQADQRSELPFDLVDVRELGLGGRPWITRMTRARYGPAPLRYSRLLVRLVFCICRLCSDETGELSSLRCLRTNQHVALGQPKGPKRAGCGTFRLVGSAGLDRKRFGWDPVIVQPRDRSAQVNQRNDAEAQPDPCIQRQFGRAFKYRYDACEYLYQGHATIRPVFSYT